MLSGIAKVCLEEGNKEYKQGEDNNAINSYTEGIQDKTAERQALQQQGNSSFPFR